MTTDTDKKVFKARVIASIDRVDIALLQLESKVPFCAAIAPESSVIFPGDDIVILGYPFGSKLHDDVMQLNLSFTKGYISSVQSKNDLDYVLLDISAKAGNSGSPVINVSTGEVIGILCGSILNQSDTLTEEMNYMRPIKYFWENLTEN